MKVIRDNLHGDIEFHPEEMRLLHTAGFERLHGCRQLGLAHLIYPGAKHARFEHVLGVMYVADKIASRMKRFFEGTGGDHLRRILRFSALLHDMGHVPFGHTLEDEMPIIEKHDHSSGDGSGSSRMDQTVAEVLRESQNEPYLDPVLQVLRAIDDSKDDDKLYESVQEGSIKPEYLVLADIIGNTICADLLDYIKRDHSMTGIRATYDSRIFRYFDVGEHKGHKRAIIQLVRHGRVRNDALADLLDILKLRYNLSDKVLFHPKKCAAGAMIIRAVSEAGLKAEDLMKYSDDGLLDYLSESPLIKSIRKWELFKPVFLCGLHQINTYDERHDKKDLIVRLQKDESLRKKIEARILEETGLLGEANSVLIYCPNPKMSLKPVRVLVRWKDGTIKRLNEIAEDDDQLTYNQVNMLQQIYPQLWKLYLFVAPRLRTHGKRLQEKFCEILETETGLSATCDPAFRHYLETGCPDFMMGELIDRELELHPIAANIAHKEMATLRQKCHNSIPPDPFSDEFADAEPKVLANRDDDGSIRQQARRIVEGALNESAKGKRRNPAQADLLDEGSHRV
jgi:HD superfamily phosphohydrolase